MSRIAESELARRAWVASRQPGDVVEIAFSRFPEDILQCRVRSNDGQRMVISANDGHLVLDVTVPGGWVTPDGINVVEPGTTVPY